MAKLVKSESLGAISSSHEDEVDQGPLDPCNVFVKYLPQELRDSDLSALFATFGEVISSKIMLDPASRKSLGFGYVIGGCWKLVECGPFLSYLSIPVKPAFTLDSSGYIGERTVIGKIDDK